MIGQSDRVGACPAGQPYARADFAATGIYQASGIDPATELIDRLDRPIQLCAGEPIHPLLNASTT